MIPFAPRRSPVYIGTGALATYGFTFKVFSKTDIQVEVVTDTGTESTLIVDVDYTVALNADQDNFPGGSITLTAGNLTLDYLLVIYGAMPYSQTTQLPTGGSYNATLVEQALDKLSIQIQQIEEEQGRALSFPATDDGLDNTLPPTVVRANKYLVFDADGNPSYSAGTGADIGLRADLVAANGSTLVSYQPSGIGAVVRTLQARLRDQPLLSTDYSTLQQALTAAAAAGRELKVLGNHALGSTTITVPANSIVDARNATLTWTGHCVGLEFGSNVDWLGGRLVGAGNAAYNAAGYAIRCIGTYNHPAAPTYITGPRIAAVTIDGWGNYGFWGQYLDGGYMRGCTVRNIGYNGIGGGSLNDFHEEFNLIDGISPGVPTGDTYGTAIDRFEVGTETSNPRSYRCVISHNTFKNISNTAGNNAQAIDTHAGVDFVITSNTIDGCEVGIAVTGSSVGGVQMLGPKRCIIANNTLRGSKVGYGILVSGAIVGASVNDYAEGIIVSGNSIDGYGAAGDASGLTGAIFCQGTKRLVINGGSCSRPACYGLSLGLANIGFSVQGLAVTDAHDNTLALPGAVHVAGNDNRGYIGNVTAHYENGVAATNIMPVSVRVAAGLTGLDVDIGPIVNNGADATHLVLSLGTTVGVNTARVMQQSGRAQISLTTAAASASIAVTLPRRMPLSQPRIQLTLASAPVPGSVVKAALIESVSPSATGFTITARPYDISTFGGNGTLEVDWVVTT